VQSKLDRILPLAPVMGLVFEEGCEGGSEAFCQKLVFFLSLRPPMAAFEVIVGWYLAAGRRPPDLRVVHLGRCELHQIIYED